MSATISPAQRYMQMTDEMVKRAGGKPLAQRWWAEYDRVRRAAEKALADYEAAREAKADRYRTYAERAAGRSAAAMDREHAIADMIPPGQPLLIGHASERHHRRDMTRMDNLIRKAIEEDGKAAYWQRKAAHVENARIVRSADPDAVRKLREKLERLECQRSRRKAINKQLKAGAALADLALTPRELDDLVTVQRHQSYYGKGYVAGTCFPPYSISNIGAEIRRVKERIAALEGGQE
jgi:hypothetical protein